MADDCLRAGEALVFPGQQKPQFFPRIDWSHPLTKGLIAYWFDTGMGFYVDLVPGTYSTTGTNSTIPPLAVTQFGTAFQFPTGTGSGNNTVQGSTSFYKQAWAAPFSFACGWMQYGAPPTTQGGYFVLADTSGNEAWGVYGNSTIMGVGLGNGNPATNILTGSSNPLNQYNSLLCSAGNTTAASAWLNGTNFPIAGTIATTFSGTAMRILVGASLVNESGTGAKDQIGAYMYWGAVWLDTKSQSDAQLLWLDPYQFLMPNEMEMPSAFAQQANGTVTLAGATLTASAPVIIVTDPVAVPSVSASTSAQGPLIDSANAMPSGTFVSAAVAALLTKTIATFSQSASTVSASQVGSVTDGAIPIGVTDTTAAGTPSGLINVTGTAETTSAGSPVETVKPAAAAAVQITTAASQMGSILPNVDGAADTTTAAALKDTNATFPIGPSETATAGAPATNVGPLAPGTSDTSAAAPGVGLDMVSPNPSGVAGTSATQSLIAKVTALITGSALQVSSGSYAFAINAAAHGSSVATSANVSAMVTTKLPGSSTTTAPGSARGQPGGQPRPGVANSAASTFLSFSVTRAFGGANVTALAATSSTVSSLLLGVLLSLGAPPLAPTPHGLPIGVAGVTTANATAHTTFSTASAATFTAASTMALSVAPYFSGTPGLISGISVSSAGGPAFAGPKFNVPGVGSTLAAGTTKPVPGGQPPSAVVTMTAGKFFLNPISAQANAVAGIATVTVVQDAYEFIQVDMVATLNTLSIWTFGG